MKTRMLQILSVMMVLGLVLSACQPQVVEVEKEVVVTQVVREEVEVEVEVEKIVEVEVEKIVEKEVEKIVEVEVEKIVEVEVEKTIEVEEVEQVFTVAIGKDTGPLNPHNYASLFGALTMVYEPLVVYNADGSIGPGLAESWTVSDDGLTWTFKLRQGVTFHDGTPFDADAVKWNLEKWVGTDGHSWLPTTNIVGSIDTPDDHTVVLNNTEFYYAAIQDLALVRPVRFLSPSSADADGNFVSAVGTGPWKVDEYTTDQRTTFVPHEGYWGEQSGLEKVVLEVITDPQTRIAALLSGEVNLIGGEYLGGISLESIPVLERNEDVQVVTGVGSTSYWVMMNYHRSPFDDVKVRQAVNHAIDRETISNQLFRGLAAPAHGVFSPNIPYVTQPRPELYDLDLEQSQALLAEAGWTPGADGILEKDGQPFEISMLVDADVFPQAKSIAEVMQGTLGELGIDMQIRLLDFGGWSEALQNGEYDMATNISWGAPYDPHSSLSGMFSGGYTGTEGVIYADPALDEMIAEVTTIRDEDERQAYYDSIWTYMDENAAVAPIVYSLRVYALDGSVDGWTLPGTEYDLDLNTVSIVAR